MQEHWRIKNNRFGLFIVKGEKAIGWDKIDRIVSNYFALHPRELIDAKRANKVMRETRKNRFAASSKLRYLAELPVGLVRAIERSEPKMFQDKKLFHIFLRKFNKLRVCQEI